MFGQKEMIFAIAVSLIGGMTIGYTKAKEKYENKAFKTLIKTLSKFEVEEITIEF